MQFTFGYKREAHLLDESVLPVTRKERRGEGKSISILLVGKDRLVVRHNVCLKVVPYLVPYLVPFNTA